MQDRFSMYPYVQKITFIYSLMTERMFCHFLNIFRKHFVSEENNRIMSEGDSFKLQELANTLKVLAKEGARSFYEGSLGRQIVNDLRKLDSKISMEDLMEYK